MLKEHLYVIRSLSCGEKLTSQKYEARCHTANSVINYLNENVPDTTRKQNRSPYSCALNLLAPYSCSLNLLAPYSCALNLLDYAIWDIMKKILYKNLKRYENIKVPSAAMSYAWDRLTKTFINNSIDQWWMLLE